MNPYPDNSSHNGFYTPEAMRQKKLPSMQQFINDANGIIDVNTLNNIQNFTNQLPYYHQQALELAGETVVWLRRKTTGILCPFFNTETNVHENSSCTICFDTTFVGGFDYPIRLKMSFIPGRSDVLVEEAGLTIVQKPSAWTSMTDPIMSSFDMIVSFSNERYEVHSNEAIENRGIKHHQEMTLTRIDTYDIKYAVPVPGILGSFYKDFLAKVNIVGNYTDFPAIVNIVNPTWG